LARGECGAAAEALIRFCERTTCFNYYAQRRFALPKDERAGLLSLLKRALFAEMCVLPNDQLVVLGAVLYRQAEKLLRSHRELRSALRRRHTPTASALYKYSRRRTELGIAFRQQ